ncbi:MAG: hypothetical protein OXG85_04100 [Chloroflexi bacterium]|nr:hypothetical protein [Chloroflexota bacterium]
MPEQWSVAAIRATVLLIYAPAVVVVYFRLMPGLARPYRLFGTLMLAAHFLIVFFQEDYANGLYIDKLLWNVNREGNIPAILSGAQLFVASGAALAVAALSGGQSRLFRLYWVGNSLLLLAFGLFENVLDRAILINWQVVFPSLGAVVALFSLRLMRVSTRSSQIKYLSLLIGLTIGAVGSIGLEHFAWLYEPCDKIGLVRDGDCLSYIFEEGMEFLGIWIVLIAVLGFLSDLEQRPRPLLRITLFLMPAVWFIAVLNSPVIDYLQLRYSFQQTSLLYEGGIEIIGYRINEEENAFSLQLNTDSEEWAAYSGVGYSLHLVDQASGRSLASTDDNASRRVNWETPAWPRRWIYQQTLNLSIPADKHANRALWLLLSLWREQNGEHIPQKVLSSGLPQLSDTQIIVGELVLPVESPASSTAPLSQFDNGFALVSASMPQQAKTGETLPVTFTWRASKSGAEEYVQFLHLKHEETGEWWVYDQFPLGPRLPTRLWYNGLLDNETWQVSLPGDLAPGSYEMFTGLYRVSDLERVPASDKNGEAWRDSRVLLGTLSIAN